MGEKRPFENKAERGRPVGSLFPQLRQLTKLEVISEWEVHAGSFFTLSSHQSRQNFKWGFHFFKNIHEAILTIFYFTGRLEEEGEFITQSPQQAMLTVSCDHYTLPSSCLGDSSLFPSKSLLCIDWRFLFFLPCKDTHRCPSFDSQKARNQYPHSVWKINWPSVDEIYSPLKVLLKPSIVICLCFYNLSPYSKEFIRTIVSKKNSASWNFLHLIMPTFSKFSLSLMLVILFAREDFLQ